MNRRAEANATPCRLWRSVRQAPLALAMTAAFDPRRDQRRPYVRKAAAREAS